MKNWSEQHESDPLAVIEGAEADLGEVALREELFVQLIAECAEVPLHIRE